MGYHRAGFDVIGVDINPQPNYPFQFYQADALSFPIDGFEFVHASPPCQRFTTGAKQGRTSWAWPNLIEPIRERLLEASVRYVIENVPGARSEMLNPVRLCGTMFGLGVIRHRLFESDMLTVPAHPEHRRSVGDGYETVAGHPGGSSSRDGWKSGGVNAWRAALGIGWMTSRELAEAIPPAYTEYVGRQLMAHLQAQEAA